MKALLISGIAFATVVVLLLMGDIGETVFAFLAAASALLGFALHNYNRLQELDLKNLRITLRELRETKQEIFVREERLKSAFLPLIQLLAYQSAAANRWSSSESLALSRAWYKKKLNILLEAMDADSAEAQEARKFIDKYDEIDRLFAGRGALKTTDPDYEKVKAQIELLNDRIIAMLRKDTEGSDA